MFNTLRTSHPGASFEAQSLFQARLTALRIFALKGYVGLSGACTANQYSFLTGLSRVTLLSPGTVVPSEECGAIFTMSYDFVICATPACISGDYPYFANVCELSTSVTSQQGIFVDARLTNP